ncbi:hypothetical protein D3C71_1275310 [compost metagenome]
MGGGFHVLQADFREGRHIGQLRQAGRVGDSQRLDLAAIDEAGARRQVHHHRGNLPAGHIGQRGRRAAIGDVREGQAGFDLQQFHRQVMRTARPGRRVVQPVLAALGLGQELLHRVDLHRRSDDQDHREAAHQRDGRQVLRRVIRQLLIERGVEHQRAVVGGQHRVPVGRGARGFRGGDGGVAAGLVLDHDRLAQPPRQPLADAARQKIGPAAGRIGHDPAHGLGRIGGVRLLGGCAGTGQQGQGQQAGQKMVLQVAHAQVSFTWNVLMASLICVNHIRYA